MKKPKWNIYKRLLSNSLFSWKLYHYIQKELLWKDKYNSPRIELLPKYIFRWLWFEIEIVQGNDQDFEWYLWVTKYSDNDINKAIETWPWGKHTEDGKFIKDNPHLKYNK